MGYIPLLGFLQDSSSRVSPPQDSYSRGPPPGSLFQDSSSRIPLPAFLSESFTSIASINCLGSHAGVILESEKSHTFGFGIKFQNKTPQ